MTDDPTASGLDPCDPSTGWSVAQGITVIVGLLILIAVVLSFVVR
jgi:hypothetical protein